MAHPTGQRGLTLVELMVTVTILVILLITAVPSFTNTLAYIKLKAVADSLYSGLQVARAEGVRLNTNVVFAMDTATNNWLVVLASGYVSSKLPCDATLTTYIRQSCGEGSGVTNSSNFTSVSFNSQGRVSAVDLAAFGALPTVSLSAAGITSALQISISSGGQTRMCVPGTAPNTTDPKYCNNL